MCGWTLKLIPASSAARANSFANPEGVNGPPRSDAKTNGEADWRLSSRSARSSSPRSGCVAGSLGVALGGSRKTTLADADLNRPAQRAARANGGQECLMCGRANRPLRSLGRNASPRQSKGPRERRVADGTIAQSFLLDHPGQREAASGPTRRRALRRTTAR
jgi:hypothetical protein